MIELKRESGTGKKLIEMKVSPNVAVFFTPNPDYAGRSNLPENLKNNLHFPAMTTPDVKFIAEVLLFSEGFITAPKLAQQIVDVFNKIKRNWPKATKDDDPKYNLGIETLRSTVKSAGKMRQDCIKKIREKRQRRGENDDFIAFHHSPDEQDILCKSVISELVEKISHQNEDLFFSVLRDTFRVVLTSSLI